MRTALGVLIAAGEREEAARQRGGGDTLLCFLAGGRRKQVKGDFAETPWKSQKLEEQCIEATGSCFWIFS